MIRIRENIAEAQRLAEQHIKELKAQAEELMKRANEVAAFQIKKDQESILEKRKLDELEYNQTRAEKEAKAKLLDAQKKEELAKTNQDVLMAQDEAKKAQEAIDRAEEERKRIEDAKKALQETILSLMAKTNQAKEEAANATANQKKFEELIAESKRQAAEAIKAAETQMKKDQSDYDKFLAQ
jgi:hypothetical protein